MSDDQFIRLMHMLEAIRMNVRALDPFPNLNPDGVPVPGREFQTKMLSCSDTYSRRAWEGLLKLS